MPIPLSHQLTLQSSTPPRHPPSQPLLPPLLPFSPAANPPARRRRPCTALIFCSSCTLPNWPPRRTPPLAAALSLFLGLLLTTVPLALDPSLLSAAVVAPVRRSLAPLLSAMPHHHVRVTHARTAAHASPHHHVRTRARPVVPAHPSASSAAPPGRSATEAPAARTARRPAVAGGGARPPSKTEVGNAGWTFIHAVAANFPMVPTDSDKYYARSLLKAVSKLYPCKKCRHHFDKYLAASPPDVSSRDALVLWACQAHNDVNRRTGKPEFPCQVDLLDRRWGDCGCDRAIQ